MPDGVFIEQQSFAEGTNCNRGSLLEPFSNTINKNEAKVEKRRERKILLLQVLQPFHSVWKILPFIENRWKRRSRYILPLTTKEKLKVKTGFFLKFLF